MLLATSFVILLIPLWIALGIVVVASALALVGRIDNGRYLRPLVQLLAKVPLFRRWLEKGSRAAIERTNPELASALRKLEPHAKQMHDPQQAQRAMSRLTREERRAVLEMQEQQGGGVPEEAMNRQTRRRLEKAKRNAGRR